MTIKEEKNDRRGWPEESTPSTEQESQEELWNDVDQNYIRWNDQEIKLSDLLKDFKINRK